MMQSSWSGANAIEPRFDMPESARERRLDIRFTGSGSEYFRIWIVNLLLTIVTLSLYHPWAKVRRLRYFHGNTLVDGHALDFHGDPKKMLRGYLFVALLALIYSVATRFSPVAGLVAFGIMAVIWPMLFKASMQFKLANTSWRGLRFRFKGDVAGAYKAMLPLFVPGLLFLFVVAWGDKPPSQDVSESLGFAALAVIGASVLLVPLLLWNLKKYQHGNYALGQVQTRLQASRGSFYAVFFKTIGVSILAGIALSIVLGVVMAAGFAGVLTLGSTGGKPNVAVIIAGIALGFLLMVGMQLIPRPYFESRMQNLLWGRTAGDHLRFKSELRFAPLLWLTLKNWFLMVVTLGLYWPFAKVALARIRLQAVAVLSTLSIDQLHDHVRLAGGDAAGDAAGDFFGIDIGL